MPPWLYTYRTNAHMRAALQGRWDLASACCAPELSAVPHKRPPWHSGPARSRLLGTALLQLHPGELADRCEILIAVEVAAPRAYGTTGVIPRAKPVARGRMYARSHGGVVIPLSN